MSFRQPLLPQLGIETAAVVGDREPRNATVHAQFDTQRRGGRIRDHVPHSFLRDSVDQGLLLAIEAFRAVHCDRHVNAARLERADEIGDRSLEPCSC